MRASRMLAAAVLAVTIGALAPSAASAAKIKFASGTTKAFTGYNTTDHVFAATGTGGPITVSCKTAGSVYGATFTGTATLNAQSVVASPVYKGCSYTQGGLSGAATVTCASGAFNIAFANTSVNTSTGAITDTSSSAFGTVSVQNGGCDIAINANCTLTAGNGGPYRFNTGGTPGQDGTASGLAGGTFPNYASRNAVRLIANTSSNISIGTKSGKNCAAFGFAASPTTYASGQYQGTVQVNDLWAENNTP